MILTFSGPSCAGKSTIIKAVCWQDKSFRVPVSFTTRLLMEGEIEGDDYNHRTRERFADLVGERHFAEWAEHLGYFYGTPKDAIEEIISAGYNILMDLNCSGARQIKILYPDAVSCFIRPPDLETLERRIRKRRRGESEEDIWRRLAIARSEIDQRGWFDYCITNEKLEDAVDEVLAVIQKVRIRDEHDDMDDSSRTSLPRIPGFV